MSQAWPFCPSVGSVDYCKCRTRGQDPRTSEPAVTPRFWGSLPMPCPSLPIVITFTVSSMCLAGTSLQYQELRTPSPTLPSACQALLSIFYVIQETRFLALWCWHCLWNSKCGSQTQVDTILSISFFSPLNAFAFLEIKSWASSRSNPREETPVTCCTSKRLSLLSDPVKIYSQIITSSFVFNVCYK